MCQFNINSISAYKIGTSGITQHLTPTADWPSNSKGWATSMEPSEDDLIDLYPHAPPPSIRERARRLEQNTAQHSRPGLAPGTASARGPPSLRRSLTTPDVPTVHRPSLNQGTSTSEEFIQKTRSGILDLKEKGKTTFQQAGNSVSDFRDRMLQRENSWNSLLWPSESDQSRPTSSRALSRLDSDDEEDEITGRAEPSLKFQPESQLPETDRREVSVKSRLEDRELTSCRLRSTSPQTSAS